MTKTRIEQAKEAIRKAKDRIRILSSDKDVYETIRMIKALQLGVLMRLITTSGVIISNIYVFRLVAGKLTRAA